MNRISERKFHKSGLSLKMGLENLSILTCKEFHKNFNKNHYFLFYQSNNGKSRLCPEKENKSLSGSKRGAVSFTRFLD
jgi:hypothetical protein